MRPEKEAITTTMRQYVEDSEFAFLVDHSGLTVEGVTELRGKLREKGSEFHVVKNRLFKIIADEMGWARVPELLTGGSALVTGDDSVGTAKVLREFMTGNGKPELKGGMDGASFLEAGDIKAMALLPSIDIMRGMFVGTLAAPMSGLVGALNQKLLSLVYVLKAAAESKGEE